MPDIGQSTYQSLCWRPYQCGRSRMSSQSEWGRPQSQQSWDVSLAAFAFSLADVPLSSQFAAISLVASIIQMITQGFPRQFTFCMWNKDFSSTMPSPCRKGRCGFRSYTKRQCERGRLTSSGASAFIAVVIA